MNCAVLCVKEDWKGQFWGLRYCLSKLRTLLGFPLGMTSHSKIAQFNWECIGRLKLKFTDWISRYSKRLKALELILYAQIFKLVRISFLYSPPISFLHIQSSYISSLRNYEVSCPAIFTSCAICLRGFKHSPLFLVFFFVLFLCILSPLLSLERERRTLAPTLKKREVLRLF